MNPSLPTPIAQLIDGLHRQEAGRMVAMLTRLFGLHNLALAEDVVQDAFAKAVVEWPAQVPAQPGAWLMKVAKNKAIDLVRQQRHRQRFADEVQAQLQSGYTAGPAVQQLFLDHEVADSQLRMIFACCHPELSEEDQILLTLKTCCGLDVEECAHALLLGYEASKKRLQRARAAITERGLAFEIPTGAHLGARLAQVLRVLYLMFNEGYKSSTQDHVIRHDLCQEAMRLTLLVCGHPLTAQPPAQALMALMCLQAARFEARLDAAGEIVQLQDQDRSLWNRELIEIGMGYLNASADGGEFTEYHLQAGIALTHAQAPSFAETDWRRIHALYSELDRIAPSPMVALNKAIVCSKVAEPQVAMAEFMAIPGVEAFTASNYLFAATKAELHGLLGEVVQAMACMEQAHRLAPTAAEKRLMARKLDALRG